jgi:hypothetical protein
VVTDLVLPWQFEPRRYQAPYLDYVLDHPKGGRSFWLVHRRGGKDLVGLHAECSLAMERVGVYWHCLPKYEQARKAIWRGFLQDGRPIIDAVFPKQIVRRKNDTEMFVELTNGSIVQLVGSDAMDSLVGSGPVGVVFSEFALSRPSSWDLVRPILRENGGWASFITTPRGRNHAFRQYEIARKSEGWFCERLPLTETDAWRYWKQADGSPYRSAEHVMECERAEGMDDAMVRQEYLVDFAAAMMGSFYGDLLEAMEARGAMEAFQHERDAVFTGWDLGHTDSTGIWFWRVRDEGVEFIDHFEAHGKPMSFYFDKLDEKAETMGYQYLKHWLPHDARAKTLQTGESILDQCLQRWGSSKVAIVPRLSVPDGIQAARWLLQQPGTRFHPRCNEHEGIEALRQYHREWDEDGRCFKTTPEHDWSSHSADAFRYSALVYRTTERNTRKPVPVPQKPVAVPLREAFTLDELYEERGDRKERL